MVRDVAVDSSSIDGGSANNFPDVNGDNINGHEESVKSEEDLFDENGAEIKLTEIRADMRSMLFHESLVRRWWSIRIRSGKLRSISLISWHNPVWPQFLSILPATRVHTVYVQLLSYFMHSCKQLLEWNPQERKEGHQTGPNPERWSIQWNWWKQEFCQLPFFSDYYTSHIGRVSPKIKDLQEQLRQAQYKSFTDDSLWWFLTGSKRSLHMRQKFNDCQLLWLCP